MPTLFCVSNEPDIVVEGGTIVVGRHPVCDVRLMSLRISRRHCIMTAKGGELVVRDLGSTNGTWVNGRRVRSARLEPGDEIFLAHVRYYFEKAQRVRSSADANERQEPN
jgi:pSer/pThr/pTyr-binding forkhead associated (FHA) protein